MRVLALALLVSAATAGAQTASVSGFVAADSNGSARLANAEVTIAALRMTARTNWLGEFVVGPLASGRYLVSVRHLGYVSYQDSVMIGDDTHRNFVLAKPPALLDSVVATASAPRKWISPALNAFEERRTAGSGGHFIDAAILRRSDSRALVDVLTGYTPGLSFMRRGGNAAYAYSTRNPQLNVCALCRGSMKKPAGDSKLSDACYATVYLDGGLVYDMTTNGRSAPPPDLNEFRVEEMGAVEFYGGDATVPMPYKSSGCGTLLLWTRER